MSAADSPALQKPATLSVSIGFAMMCFGMFMAILDVQVVATSLPTIQSALAIPPDRMNWVQTAYLIAEVIAIPLTGFLTRADDALAVRSGYLHFHAGVAGLRRQRRFRRADRLADLAGFFRGDADPRRLLGGVPALPNFSARPGDDIRRCV